tara:strand:- start:443 stop:649 length:207 start_codon:yes stop_codon:yes gene_type:complete
VIGTAVGVFLFLYAGYCWREQGIHTRYEGWKTREEAPRTFVWSMWFYVIFAFVLIVVDALNLYFKARP